jgi:hypothetical protein
MKTIKFILSIITAVLITAVFILLFLWMTSDIGQALALMMVLSYLSFIYYFSKQIYKLFFGKENNVRD